MYGRIYYINTGFQTVSAAQDLLEILAPSDLVFVLHGIEISQSSDTDMEFLQIAIKRASGSYTSGSGGGTPTAIKKNFGAVACSCTLKRNNTTQASAGSGAIETIWNAAIPVLGGDQRILPPELRPIFSPSQALVVSLSAPADALTLNCTAIIEEIGG